MNKNAIKGCFCSKAAFTLIELLVVVLIIGILAAVAVPQYKKAVLKSHYNALKPLVKTVADAEEVYYLANGKYASTIEELDVSFPGIPTETETDVNNDITYYFPWGRCILQIHVGISRVSCKHESAGLTYARVLQHPKSFITYAGMQKCTATASKPATVQICQQESGLTQGNHPGNGELTSYYW